MAKPYQGNDTTSFRDDTGLILLAPVARPGRWFNLCAVSLAVMMAAYLFAARDLRQIPIIPTITTDEGVNQKVVRYVADGSARVVILGSSLAERLDERYFTMPGVRNLALSGGSPLTGLKLVAQLSHLPKVAVVETNVLDRATDNALVDRFKPSIPTIDRAELLLRKLKPLQMMVHWWLYGWPSVDEQRSSSKKKALKLRMTPPEDHDTSVAIQKTLSQWSKRDFEGLAQANAAEMMKVIHELERRGTKVFLLEMPFCPELSRSRYATGTRQIMEEANENADRWLQLKLDSSQLRWSDAAHLDDRSTILVIDAIERELDARLGAQTTNFP